MKLKIKKSLKTIALVQYTTEQIVKLFAKHFQYFGGETLSMYIIDFNYGRITYDQLVDNVYKDVNDYESAL